MRNLEVKRAPFEKADGKALLTVENPLVGVSYLVFWMPPDKRIVEALRKNA